MLITTIRYKRIIGQGFVIVTAGSTYGKTELSVQTYTTTSNSNVAVLCHSEIFSTEENAIRRFEKINTIVIDTNDLDLYEIYIFNDKDITKGMYEGKKVGEIAGWDIKWILGTDEGIKDYPFFDDIITKNDNSTGRRATAEVWK